MSFSDFLHENLESLTKCTKAQMWEVLCQQMLTSWYLMEGFLRMYGPAGMKATIEKFDVPCISFKVVLSYEKNEPWCINTIEYIAPADDGSRRAEFKLTTHTKPTYAEHSFITDYEKMKTPEGMQEFDERVTTAVNNIKDFIDGKDPQ